jgi:hypothetical protein
MDRQNPFDRFQLDDHFIVYEQVDLVSTIELQALVRDRQIDLALEGQTPEMQFMAQALLVGGFKQSRPELTMYLDRSPNDGGGSGVLLVLDFSVSL